jgi:hypothetical protein
MKIRRYQEPLVYRVSCQQSSNLQKKTEKSWELSAWKLLGKSVNRKSFASEKKCLRRVRETEAKGSRHTPDGILHREGCSQILISGKGLSWRGCSDGDKRPTFFFVLGFELRASHLSLKLCLHPLLL